MSPDVSILIPAFNREAMIGSCIQSALDQTISDLEVIVVDNASTDGTWDVCQQYANQDSRVRIFRNESNVGPVRNWRKCLDYALGEYVKILWSDDLIAPTFIEKTLPYLVENKAVGFVFTGTEIFYDGTERRAKAYFIGDSGIYNTNIFIEKSLLGGSLPVSPGNALFRKKDVEKNLLIDIPNKIGSDFKNHAIGNDVLIYLLTAKHYPEFGFVNEALSFFRAHSASISVSADRRETQVFYNIAKAFFVENYLTDDKLSRKFNAKLFISSLRGGKRMGIRNICDFYINDYTVDLDYLYLGKLVLGKLFLASKQKWILEKRQSPK